MKPLLRRLRAAGNATPVIFLTVLSDQFYEEAALHPELQIAIKVRV